MATDFLQGPELNDTPLYLRIYHDLVSKIRRGELEAGDKLPSESELQNMYDVSRSPVRQALGKLENERLVSRQPGRGTFVLHPTETESWGPLSGFAHLYQEYWDRIDTKTLSIKTIPPSDELAEQLMVGNGDQLIEIQRLRLKEGQPVTASWHYLSTGRVDIGAFRAAGDFVNTRVVLQQQFQIHIQQAMEDVEAVLAPPSVATILNVPKGHPLLFVERISWDLRRQPIEVTHYYVRSELWRYRAHLRG